MIQDLTISRTEITFGMDSIVVRKFTNGIVGGITLDISGYPLASVLAGQAVITDGTTYKPMPINGDGYGEMPQGFRFFGVVYRSSKATMGVSVMTRGVVNKFRMPYDFTDVMDTFTEQCPYILFSSDADEIDAWVRLEAEDSVIITSDGREIVFGEAGKKENTEGV